MSAARHADVLFVKDKKDNDLKTYVDNHKIPHRMFKDWTEVKDVVSKIISGEIPIDSVRKPKVPVN